MYKNGKDLFTYLHNQYLSTPQGKDLLHSVLQDDPTVHDAIMNQLQIHDTIMQKLALGNETPLVPNSEQVHIPQNMSPMAPQTPQQPQDPSQQSNMPPYGILGIRG